jgi:hypothetical protein
MLFKPSSPGAPDAPPYQPPSPPRQQHPQPAPQQPSHPQPAPQQQQPQQLDPALLEAFRGKQRLVWAVLQVRPLPRGRRGSRRRFAAAAQRCRHV